MRAALLKGLLICLVLGLGWTSPLNTDTQTAEEAWESFVKTYEKTYASDEEYQARKQQFLENYAEIDSHNAKYQSSSSGITYKTGVNTFSDLSTKEFLEQYTGLQVPETKNDTIKKLSLFQSPSVGLPTSFDWRNYNVLNRVRNQGGCGSCWAFASIATVEAAYNIKRGALTGSFSEQHLVDCDGYDNGCGGGWPSNALVYLANYGAATQTGYPYTGVRGTCKSYLASTAYRSFTPYIATSVSDASLQYYLYTYGPLVVTIDATSLKSYTGGILNMNSCSTVNHAVNVVGYVTTGPGAPYYILRNSWGTSWGEGGYFRLSASTPCFIRNNAWFVVY